MAEKRQKSTLQKKPKKKISAQIPPDGRIEGVGRAPAGGPKVPPKSWGERARVAVKAQRARRLAQIKLAAASQKGVITNVQPPDFEDIAMTVEDPGLKDAMLFTTRLETGEARQYSEDETKAAREQRRKQLMELKPISDSPKL